MSQKRVSLLFALFAVCTHSKCVDKLVTGKSHLHDAATEENVVMEWRSSMGDSCLDYKMLLYCNADGSSGLNWASTYPHATFATFAVDGYDATTACCACGGGHEVDEKATPAPTTSINDLGGRYHGSDGKISVVFSPVLMK